MEYLVANTYEMKTKLLPVLLFCLMMIAPRYGGACTISLVGARSVPVGSVMQFLRDNQSSKTVLSYSWDFGDGSSSNDTAQYVLHKYNKAGAYTVTYTVNFSDNTSCGYSLSAFVVYDMPNFEPIGAVSGCSPFTLHLRKKPGTNVEYNIWHLGDSSVIIPGETVSKQLLITNPPSDSIVTLKFNAPKGHFRVSLTQTDTFHDPISGKPLVPVKVDFPLYYEPNQIWVDVFPNSPISLTMDNRQRVTEKFRVTASSLYGEYKKFEWDLGTDSPTVTTSDSFINASYTYQQFQAQITKGFGISKDLVYFNIIVKATSDNGCVYVDTLKAMIDDGSGIVPDRPNLSAINIYPNPFTGSTQLSYTLGKSTNAHIEVLDIAGKSLGMAFQGIQEPGAHELNIDAPLFNLKSGIYMLKISTDEGSVVRRLVRM